MQNSGDRRLDTLVFRVFSPCSRHPESEFISPFLFSIQHHQSHYSKKIQMNYPDPMVEVSLIY